MPTQTATPDLVSKLTKLEQNRKNDVVRSRSRRPKLGGEITEVRIRPDGQHYVVGPKGEDWGEYKNFASALKVAREGQPQA
jgi:hypothetical protein